MSDVANQIITWQLSVGNLIEIGMIGIGLVTIVNRLQSQILIIRNEVAHLQTGMKSLAEAFKQLGTVLTQVAVQDTRLNMIEKRVDELSHGQGFINGAET